MSLIGAESILDPDAYSCWTFKQQMRCLGHIISANGSIEADFEQAKASMWAAFWINFRPSLRNATKDAKLRFLRSCIASIGRFKWSRWPFQPTYAKRLDQIQTHMIALLFPCQPKDLEEKDSYFQRRSLLAGRLASSCGRWSAAWANAVCRWHDHCVRAHDTRNWCSFVYLHRGADWLAAQRLQNSRQGERNRTNTRSYRGKVTRRYFEGHEQALRWQC